MTAAFSPLIDRVGGELTIQFPAVDGWPEGLDPTWTYQITYETPFPEEAAIEEAVAFQNTAWLNDYTVTVEWNGTVPEQGYGLVKEVYASDLNTGTDVGTVTWLSTISYPSGDYDLEHLAYVDWIQDQQPSREEAFQKLLTRIHPGAIVLLHNTSSTNAEILDELLTKWEEMGYEFHSLKELTGV